MMLEPNLRDCMGTGLFRKESNLLNLVTGGVNVIATGSTVRSSRKESNGQKTFRGVTDATDSTQ